MTSPRKGQGQARWEDGGGGQGAPHQVDWPSTPSVRGAGDRAPEQACPVSQACPVPCRGLGWGWG